MNPHLSSNSALSLFGPTPYRTHLINSFISRDAICSRFGVGPVDANRDVLGMCTGVTGVTAFETESNFFFSFFFLAGFGAGEGCGVFSHSGRGSGALRVRCSSAITGSGCGSGGSGASSKPGGNMGGGEVSEKLGKSWK